MTCWRQSANEPASPAEQLVTPSTPAKLPPEQATPLLVNSFSQAETTHDPVGPWGAHLAVWPAPVCARPVITPVQYCSSVRSLLVYAYVQCSVSVRMVAGTRMANAPCCGGGGGAAEAREALHASQSSGEVGEAAGAERAGVAAEEATCQTTTEPPEPGENERGVDGAMPPDEWSRVVGTVTTVVDPSSQVRSTRRTR
jgi:hypothetical protein